MYTIFNREPFTPWKIVIVDRYIDKTMEEIEVENPNGEELSEFLCTYRTTLRDGKECELFTMMSNVVDYVFLQLYIFKNGDIRYTTNIPASIDILKRKKRIGILPLVYCNYNAQRNVMEYKSIEC